MPSFSNYTPVYTPEKKSYLSGSTNMKFSGPLDEYLQGKQEIQSASTESSGASLESDTTSNSYEFKWSSGGATEAPYVLQVVSQPTELLILVPLLSQQVLQPQNDLQTTPINKGTSGIGEEVVKWALSKVGRPYVWGAKGQNDTYDCSGLAYAAYKAMGVTVPGSTSAWLSSDKQKIGRNDGQPGDVIITGSKGSPSGRHARIITKNLGNGRYACVEAKGKQYGVVTSEYTVDSNLLNIYRAKLGAKLIRNTKKKYGRN